MNARGPAAGVRLLLAAGVLAGAAGCATVPAGPGGSMMLAYSPIGDILATSDDERSEIKLRDARTLADHGALRGTAPSEVLRRSVRSLAFSRDGTRLLAVGIDDTVLVWEVATGRELFRRPDLHGARQGALSPDGTLVLVAGPGHDASVWRVADQQRIAELKGHFDDVTAVAFSHRGDVIATGSADRTVRLWRLGRPESATLPEWHRQPVTELAFSPDDILLAALAGDLKLWRVADRRSIAHSLEAAETPQMSPEMQALVTLLMIVGSARSIQLGGGPLGLPPAGAATTYDTSGPAMQIGFSPDGRWLAVLRRASPYVGSGEIVIAEVAGNRVTRINCQCVAMAFHPNGRALATAGERIRFWDPDTGEPLALAP